MRRSRHFPALPVALLLLATLALLSGCGGSSSDGGTRVNVSVTASAADAAPVRTAAAPVDGASPPASLPDHAWITVTKVALLPADGAAMPDPGGEQAVYDNDAPPPGGRLVRTLPEAVEVDLLSLSSLEGALFLDSFDSVPAGTYRKLRLYYSDPKVHFPGDADNTAAHATANYHIDLHFRDGGLVVPVSTDADVRIVNVTINFVLGNDGLKITVAGNGERVLMRPQVFCTADALKYLLRGTALRVDGGAAAFDLRTSTERTFAVRWNGSTLWDWVDDGVAPPRSVAVLPATGASSLRDTAGVAVTGEFDAATGDFLADRIAVTFPALRADFVLSGWAADNTFVVGPEAGPLAVTPVPSRPGARYDYRYSLDPLGNGDALIFPGVPLTIRGYPTPSGIDAFWISIDVA